MAIGAYTNPTWANGGTPAINSANLQAATDQIKNITDAAVSGGASPTKIWTSTNDGNGGQPPAPKPTGSAGIGNWVDCTRYIGGSSGAVGSWANIIFSSGTLTYAGASVGAGGFDYGAGTKLICWRIA
jgi:hypothetical protein